MGTICTNNFEKEEGTQTVDTYKNAVQVQINLGSNCIVHLIHGHYKQNRSESLLVITQLKNIHHCDPLRDYTSEPEKTVQNISNMRKTFYKAVVTKNCPYKKLFFCVLPQYRSEDCADYQQQFRNVIKQVIQNTKQVTVEMLNTIEGIHTLPNQMLISLLLRQLLQIKVAFKLQLVTSQKKMMSLYKYQLMKTQACAIRSNSE